MGHLSEEGRPDGRPRLLPFAIDHEATDLREAVATAASHAATLLPQYRELASPEELLEAARGIDVDRLAFEHLWPMVMLDQVGSPAVEYRDAAGRARWPTNPKPRKTRRGLRLFPPDEPVVWEVG